MIRQSLSRLYCGFKLINKPGIRHFVIVPLLINLMIFVLAIFYGWEQFNKLMQHLMILLPAWLQWLEDLLWIIASVSALFILSMVFTAVMNLIAAPFNSLLSEKVQIALTNEAPPILKKRPDLIKMIARSFVRQLRYLRYYLFRALLLFGVSLIPLLHFITPLLWIVLNSWMIAVQYLDYPMDNNHIEFKDMLSMMHKKRGRMLQLGLMIQLYTMVPLLNLFVMPAAVAAGTISWVEDF